jgi:hypothetical protein
MDDKMIPAQGGLYIAELQKVAAAVTVLVNWVNKDKVVLPAALPGIVGSVLLAVSRAIGENKADNVWADLEDRIDCLETQQHELSSNVEEVRSDLDRAINCIRDAAAELASI